MNKPLVSNRTFTQFSVSGVHFGEKVNRWKKKNAGGAGNQESTQIVKKQFHLTNQGQQRTLGTTAGTFGSTGIYFSADSLGPAVQTQPPDVLVAEEDLEEVEDVSTAQVEASVIYSAGSRVQRKENKTERTRSLNSDFLKQTPSQGDAIKARLSNAVGSLETVISIEDQGTEPAASLGSSCEVTDIQALESSHLTDGLNSLTSTTFVGDAPVLVYEDITAEEQCTPTKNITFKAKSLPTKKKTIFFKYIPDLSNERIDQETSTEEIILGMEDKEVIAHDLSVETSSLVFPDTQTFIYHHHAGAETISTELKNPDKPKTVLITNDKFHLLKSRLKGPGKFLHI